MTTATQLANPNTIVVGGHVYPALAGPDGSLVTSVSGQVTVATLAALQALSYAFNGQVTSVQADGSTWRYAAASTLTTDTSGPFLVATATGIGAGAWLREDRVVEVVLPITFATANLAVLWTVPAGWRLRLANAWWEVTTSFTGGTSSAIGLSSSNANLSAAGYVLGGSGGDVAATLVSTGELAKGTKGTGQGNPGNVLIAGETIKFNQIASAFTAGAGNAHVQFDVLVAPPF